MKKFKNSIFYLLIIGAFSVFIYWLIRTGEHLETGRHLETPTKSNELTKDFFTSLLANVKHPLALLLIQIITIVLVARLLGWICKKIRQPSVIGEIVAGIVLGPSLLGAYLPHVESFLFPAQSLGNLQFLSQIGLMLFMFVIGMELDLNVLRNKAHDAVVISHASIIIPFSLGVTLAYFIYDHFAPPGIHFASFGLFVGISMSITAFPVLARIIQERGIHKTKLGTIVITCAAADDITAWCILAAVIAIVKAGTFVTSLYTIALAVAYVLLMIKGVRPFLKRVSVIYSSKEQMSKGIVAMFFITLVISSWVTEVIGIHALFGAFMAGAIMPESNKFRDIFIEKIEDIALVLLLPLFFVFTGLRTQIGLLNEVYLWKVAGLIIVVAVSGKFLGSALAAKFVGQNWKDSLMIGALMNTRGLMELVVLNIGYDLGVLTPEVFAMMVIMALVTTFMTGPALDSINWFFRTGKKSETRQPGSSKFNILVAFGTAERGRGLLRLANSLVKKLNAGAAVTVMHLQKADGAHHYDVEEYERSSFEPVIDESAKLGQPITTLFKVTDNIIGSQITDIANKGEYDLLLVGIGKSIYEGTLLGRILGFTTRIIDPERLIDQVSGKDNLFENSPFDDNTRLILAKSNIPVGVFIDKDLEAIRNVFIPDVAAGDAFVMKYAQQLVKNNNAFVTVKATARQVRRQLVAHKMESNEPDIPVRDYFTAMDKNPVDKVFLGGQDLMLVSAKGWKKLIKEKPGWLPDIPSTLVIGHK